MICKDSRKLSTCEEISRVETMRNSIIIINFVKLKNYLMEKEKTYDVVFHDETSDNNKGWSESYEYCKDYIEQYNGTNESYFADYKGGTVAIYCNETEEEVYWEKVK